DQKYVVYGAPLDINKNIEIKVTVDPQGIPSDEVVGWIRTSGGEIIPLKFKGEENNHYAFGADLPRISLDDFEAEAVVTAGLWEQVQKFIVSAKISPRDREEIREESHEKFMIDTPQGSRRVELPSEAALTMKVKVPFAKEHLMDRVSLGIYTTTRSAHPKDWRFLSHDEYCVTDFYWKNGYLGWTISYTPSLSGKLTFALFDKLEDTMAPPAAISWANKEGDDIEVRNIVPIFSPVKGGAPGANNFTNSSSNSPVENFSNDFNKARRLMDERWASFELYILRKPSASPIITPLLKTHGDMYDFTRMEIWRRGYRKALIFNFDAHPDNYLKDDSSNDSTWAWKLGREGSAIVVHMPSYFDGGYKKAKTNWRQRRVYSTMPLDQLWWALPRVDFEEQHHIVGEKSYPEWALYLYERYKDAVDSVWVTIDYDFFSLLSEVENPRMDGRYSIYHLSYKMIDEELACMAQFFSDNKIRLEMVIPSMPSDYKEYFNLPEGIKKGHFTEEVTARIHRVFNGLPHSGASAVIVTPCLETHGNLYNLAKDRIKQYGYKKALIFNFDAHQDNFTAEDPSHDATWAEELVREGYCSVISMRSYYDGVKKIKTNWRNSEIKPVLGYSLLEEYLKANSNGHYAATGKVLYTELVLYLYKKYRESVDTVWVTIDYDFFSFRKLEEGIVVPVYHLTYKAIDRELAYMVEFFRNNGITIDMVIPSLPSKCFEYLNLRKNMKKEIYAEKVTAQITRAFLTPAYEDKDGFNIANSSPLGENELEEIGAVTIFSVVFLSVDLTGGSSPVENRFIFSAHINSAPKEIFTFPEAVFHAAATPWSKPNLITLWQRTFEDVFLSVGFNPGAGEQVIIRPRGSVIENGMANVPDIDLIFYIRNQAYAYFRNRKRPLPYSELIQRFARLAAEAGLHIEIKPYSQNSVKQKIINGYDNFNHFPAYIKTALGKRILLDIHDVPLSMMSPQLLLESKNSYHDDLAYTPYNNYYGAGQALVDFNHYIAGITLDDFINLRCRYYEDLLLSLKNNIRKIDILQCVRMLTLRDGVFLKGRLMRRIKRSLKNILIGRMGVPDNTSNIRRVFSRAVNLITLIGSTEDVAQLARIREEAQKEWLDGKPQKDILKERIGILREHFTLGKYDLRHRIEANIKNYLNQQWENIDGPILTNKNSRADNISSSLSSPSSSPISLPIRVPLAKHWELVNRYGAGDIGKIAFVRSNVGNWEHTVEWIAQGINEGLLTELINAIKGYVAKAPPHGLQKLDIILTLDPQKLDVQNTIYALTIDAPTATLTIHPWLIEAAKDSSLAPLLTNILRLAFKSLETNFYQLAVSDSYVYYAPRQNELIQLLKVIDEKGLVLDEEYVAALRQLNALQFTDVDSYLFSQGTHQRLFEKLGAHIVKVGDKTVGTYFAVWAPHAQEVCLLGDFNGWRYALDYMHRIEYNGIWVIFVPKIGNGSLYKFAVKGADGTIRYKSDPFAFFNQSPTHQQQYATASIVWDIAYQWNDEVWMKERAAKQAIDAAISVLQVHHGSWMRGENNRWLTYRELAQKLVDYIDAAKQEGMAYTHVQFLPETEHSLYSSMGYLVSCYYAPTSRYGNPQDNMYLTDFLHQNGIGVF
ncbi:MAG TPA: hypothetical protein DCL49_09160, partial [Candidatus Omnitrophica bacterium]|nr:hypothetical protein [Candidatus Omnitrophota bacterium]